MLSDGEQPQQQVLIQWANRTAEEATWEDKNVIKNQFPGFDLEDKVLLLEGGIVRDHTLERGSDVELTNPSGPREAKSRK
ncbi:hypothetical protein A2U01_0049710, partial [Trifolium medium]|nr:hypothetical protein [Trifolium medium]